MEERSVESKSSQRQFMMEDMEQDKKEENVKI
jgi:hypothetical protein